MTNVFYLLFYFCLRFYQINGSSFLCIVCFRSCCRPMSNELRLLRVLCVDTCTGIERQTSVFHGASFTYDGDILRLITGALECVTQCRYAYYGAVSACYFSRSRDMRVARQRRTLTRCAWTPRIGCSHGTYALPSRASRPVL